MVKDRCVQLEKVKNILESMDKLLVKLEKADPYGDMIENFQDTFDRELHTKRLLKLVNRDLKGCR